jgi:cell wall-associated NlpC family hydrolase
VQRAQAEVAARQAELDTLKVALGDFANASYRSGNRTTSLELIVSSSDPGTYLTRSADLAHLAQARTEQITAVTDAKARLKGASASVQQDLAAQQAVEAKVTERKASIVADLAEQQQLLGSLKAEERARLEVIRQQQAAAQLAQSQAAAAAAAARASRVRAAAPATPGPAGPAAPQASYAGPASGRAATAVQAAYAMLGRPYSYGASGPGSFDCSGLTAWAWRAAGVSLPHSSRAQYSSGRKVSQADTQPGDLVFFGNPIHHVGIYIGNGQMISAPETGDVVKIQAAFRSDYVGATRP